jgi:hypothetical protein
LTDTPKPKTARFKRAKWGGIGLVSVLFACLMIFGSSGSGATYSDSKPGTIGGTVGSIKVSCFGSAANVCTDVNFDRLLPGEPQTVTVSYVNTGQNNGTPLPARVTTLVTASRCSTRPTSTTTPVPVAGSRPADAGR